MMNGRDITIRNEAGLYIMSKDNGKVCLTNKTNATHFTSRRKAREALKKSGYEGLVWTDHNKRERKTNVKQNRLQKASTTAN